MSSHISEDKSWLNFNQRWKKMGCKKTHSVWTVGEVFMHACSYILCCYICIYARETFLSLYSLNVTYCLGRWARLVSLWQVSHTCSEWQQARCRSVKTKARQRENKQSGKERQTIQPWEKNAKTCKTIKKSVNVSINHEGNQMNRRWH